jgi:hypothetical protein
METGHPWNRTAADPGRPRTNQKREDPECFGWNELEAALFLRRGS